MCTLSYEHTHRFKAQVGLIYGEPNGHACRSREDDVRSDPADMHKLGQLPDTAASIRHTSGRQSPTSRPLLTVAAGLLDFRVDLLQRAAQRPLPVLGCTTMSGRSEGIRSDLAQ